MKQETKFKQTEIGKIPEDWDIANLQEVADILTGFPFKGEKYSDKGIKVLRGENVSIGFLRWDIEKRWNHSLEGLDKYHLADSDIVIGMDGSRVGQNRARIKNSDLPLLLAQRVARLRAKQVLDQKYLYYNIFSDRFFNHVESVRTGTSIPHISSKQIGELRIPVPPLREQSAIAKILSDLDSKIELVKQIDETLQAIAQTIFKYWFVNFEFPDEVGNSYKSNNGKLILSELGSIPEEWNAKTLEHVADAVRGFSYTGEEKDDVGGEYVFVTLNNIVEGGGFKPKFSWITSNRLKERHFLSELDLIIANTHFGVGGSNIARLLGCPALVFFPYNYSKDTGVFSHHITKIIPFNPDMKYFLYFFLKMIHKETASIYRTGTSVAGLDMDSFMKKCFVIEPPESILKKFNSIVEPLFIKLTLNHKENTVLTHLRNLLLPKLMSGKIRVLAGAK